jgi:hypothetical protein
LRHPDRKRSFDPLDLISGPPTIAVNFGLNCLEWLVGRLVDRSATALGRWWQAHWDRDGKPRRR